ncbi:hypothetical protein MPC1_8050001 [Methylocella tundrae]|nr:hypothetical protein MPC1_8050001 [Methylocella tundrae]
MSFTRAAASASGCIAPGRRLLRHIYFKYYLSGRHFIIEALRDGKRRGAWIIFKRIL